MTDRHPGDEDESGAAQKTGEAICPRCSGDGQVEGVACPECERTGKVVAIVEDV